MYTYPCILLKIESLLVEKKKKYVHKWHQQKRQFKILFWFSDATKTGNGHVERENEKWEQGRALQMKSLIGQGFNLSFVPIFLFPVPCNCSRLLSLV